MALRRSLTTMSIGVTLVILVLGMIAAHFVGRVLSKPIQTMHKTVEDISTTLNVSICLQKVAGAKDELSDMGSAINHMLAAFEDVLSQSIQTSKKYTVPLFLLMRASTTSTLRLNNKMNWPCFFQRPLNKYHLPPKR